MCVIQYNEIEHIYVPGKMLHVGDTVIDLGLPRTNRLGGKNSN